jgi:hypothetical protein
MIYLSAFLILFSTGLALYFTLSGPESHAISTESENALNYSYNPVNHVSTGIDEQEVSENSTPSNLNTLEKGNKTSTSDLNINADESITSDNSSNITSESSSPSSSYKSSPTSSSMTYHYFQNDGQRTGISTSMTDYRNRNKEQYPMLASLNSETIGDLQINFPLFLTQTEIGKLSFLDPDADVDYLKPAKLGLGIHATPGVTFYDPNPNKYFVGLDVTVNYAPSKWLIQLGAGVTRMQDVGKYDVYYTTYDSIGFYEEVTSFHYAKDNPDSIVIESHNRTVFDSIPRVGISEKNNSYTYFTVPLHLGYRIFQTRNVDAYIKAGVVFGLLVNKNEPTADFTATNASDINFERQVPARVNTNWQFTLGMHFGYRLGNRMMLSVEPYFGQYITPIYQENSGWENNKPFLFGIRTGIDITF